MADTNANIKVTVDANQAMRSLGDLQNSLKQIAGITLGSKVAKELFDLASEVSTLNQKLKSVSEGTDEANAAFDTLTGVALRTGQSLSGTVDLYQKLRNSSVFVGSSTEALATVVERFNQTLVLSGASSEGARSAIYNFSQAMQNGSLMGNDYRSMLENNGVFLKILQKELKVSSTELRMMSSEGRLSAEVVAKALLNSKDAAEAFDKTTVTLGQSMENLKTRALEAMNNFDKMTNITGLLAQAIQFVGTNISGILIAAVAALGVVFAGTIAAMAPFVAVGAAIVAGVLAIGYGIQKLIDFIVAAGASWGAFVAAMDNGAKVMANALGITYNLSKDTVKVNEEVAASQDKSNKSAADGLVTAHQRNQAALQLDKTLQTQLATENAKAMLDMKANGFKSISLEIERAIAAEKAKYVNTGETLTKQQELEIAQATRRKILGEENVTIQQQLRDLEDKQMIASTGNADQQYIITEMLKFQRQYSGETADKYASQYENLLKQTQEMETQAKLRDLLRTTPTQNEIGTIGAAAVQNTPRGQGADFLKEGEVLKKLREMDLITEQDFQDAKMLLVKKSYDQELALAQQVSAARLQMAGVTNQAIVDSIKNQMANVQMIQQGGMAGMQGMLGAMDNVMSSMSAQNRKAFEAHKALATAQAVISTYQAAAEAIAFPPGPPLSFIYVAGAIAAGMAQVSAIQSQSYSGKAVGGSVMSNTPYIVGEKGPEMFVPAGSGSIVPNSEIGGGKNVNINFNIQANDASGFDSLLMARRGMITQFVRDAMTEQGQRSSM